MQAVMVCAFLAIGCFVRAGYDLRGQEFSPYGIFMAGLIVGALALGLAWAEGRAQREELQVPIRKKR